MSLWPYVNPSTYKNKTLEVFRKCGRVLNVSLKHKSRNYNYKCKLKKTCKSSNYVLDIICLESMYVFYSCYRQIQSTLSNYLKLFI